MKHFILVLLLSLFLIGCDYGRNEFRLGVLDVAEGVMQEHPDSALNILSPYKLKDVEGRDDRARFALLYSQALDRNKIYLTSDSLISVAVEYYDKRGNAHYKTMSHYYLGRVYANRGEIENSIKHLTIAKEYVPEEDYFMQGLIYGNLGQMYIRQDSFDEALDMNESVLLAFQNSCNTTYYYRALSNKSISLSHLERFDESLEIMYRTKEYSISKKDSVRVFSISCDIALTHYKQNDYKRAYDELYEVALPYNRGELTPRAFSMISDFMLREGKIDSARLLVLSALENQDVFNDRENIEHLLQLQDIEEADGNYKKANYYGNIAYQKTDSIYIAEKEIQIQEFENKYQTQHAKDELIIAKNRHKYETLVHLFIIFVVIILSIQLFLRLRLNKRDFLRQLSEYQILAQTANIYKSDLEAKYSEIISQNDQNDYKTVKLLNVINNNIANLKALIHTANVYENNPKKFVSHIKQYISTMSNALNSDEDFINIVNLYCNGIIDYFATNFPELNSKDLYLLSYISLGFSTIELQLIYNHTHSVSTRNMRARLRGKLNLTASSESLETYIRRTILELVPKIDD